MKTVRRISRSAAARWVEAKHYRGTLGIFWEGYALVVDGMVAGVVCYGQPSPPIQRHAFADRDFRLYELTRLVVQSCDTNAASFLVGNSLKMLKERRCAVVSYADEGMNHCGIVYQATNWFYTGASKAHDKFYVVDGEKLHPTTVKDRFGITSPVKWAKENGIEMIQPAMKHRYFFLVGNKRDRKSMLKQLKYPVISEYPKAAKSKYDDGEVIQQEWDEALAAQA